MRRTNDGLGAGATILASCLADPLHAVQCVPGRVHAGVTVVDAVPLDRGPVEDHPTDRRQDTSHRHTLHLGAVAREERDDHLEEVAQGVHHVTLSFETGTIDSTSISIHHNTYYVKQIFNTVRNGSI